MLVLLAGCFGGSGDEPPDTPAAKTSECAPRHDAVPMASLLDGARGWAFGTAPVYVSFLDIPMYRAARSGPGSFVAIHRDTKRNGRYGVKVMTIVHPTFAGQIRQEVSAVTPGRKVAFSLGRGSNAIAIDRLPTTRTLTVTRGEDRVPGGIVVTGRGCYRLKLEARGQRYELAFPVNFGRAA